MPARPAFLVVGEAVADRVEWTDGRTATYPGGSPMNVAYGLGRLGCDVSFVTELGDDGYGRTIRTHLDRAQVSVRSVGRADQRTATATAVLDELGAAQYAFDISWSLPSVEAAFTPTHLHTGSIAAYLRPGADAVLQLVEHLRPTATVSFDPNNRPALLHDHADVLRRTERLVAAADVVKASDEDLRWLYPGVDALQAVRRWVDAGVALVVVTRGADGALAVTATTVLEVAPVPATVVDTVGAGDSFTAALLDGLGAAGLLGGAARPRLASAASDVLRAVLDRAARAAAITVTRPGADPPSRDDLRPRGRHDLSGRS